jgi:tetratricopeptide (TPR) repeat protein
MNLARIALLAFFLTGCDNFAEVQKADTIEAYTQYLDENPDSRYRLEATIRLEELYFETARKDKTLEAFDRYLEKYPHGTHSTAAKEEREGFLFESVRETNTVESWTRYLEAYPSGYKAHRQEAKRGLIVAEYSAKIAIGEAAISQVNLAEDPKGPLNGWGFKAEVTNNGDMTLQTLKLRIHYLDESGKSLDAREWPVVASNWPLPMPAEYEAPMKPGHTRTWDWSTGDLPADWAQKVRLEVSYLSYKK